MHVLSRIMFLSLATTVLHFEMVDADQDTPSNARELRTRLSMSLRLHDEWLEGKAVSGVLIKDGVGEVGYFEHFRWHDSQAIVYRNFRSEQLNALVASPSKGFFVSHVSPPVSPLTSHGSPDVLAWLLSKGDGFDLGWIGSEDEAKSKIVAGFVSGVWKDIFSPPTLLGALEKETVDILSISNADGQISISYKGIPAEDDAYVDYRSSEGTFWFNRSNFRLERVKYRNTDYPQYGWLERHLIYSSPDGFELRSVNETTIKNGTRTPGDIWNLSYRSIQDVDRKLLDLGTYGVPEISLPPRMTSSSMATRWLVFAIGAALIGVGTYLARKKSK